MKKIISLLTVFTLLFCLAACSNNNTPEGDNPSSSGEIQSSVDNRQDQPDDSQNPPSSLEENPDSTSEPTETGSKALVVYFSHSGNTESVEKEIQSQTGADIFEIVPATPYTTDYNTMLDVAQNEKRDNARSEKENLTPAYTIDGQSITWNRSANGYRLPCGNYHAVQYRKFHQCRGSKLLWTLSL